MYTIISMLIHFVKPFLKKILKTKKARKCELFGKSAILLRELWGEFPPQEEVRCRAFLLLWWLYRR